MRLALVVGACALLAGCESMSQKVDASRQERCQKADWAMVGERDGVAGSASYADRYSNICGDLFNAGAYREGFSKGAARRPRPPV
jgi:hypothetical protein